MTLHRRSNVVVLNDFFKVIIDISHSFRYITLDIDSVKETKRDFLRS
ncbi:CRISPR-associated DxTHG motif protein [Shewanella maritima]|uniref:CRISPR-associated DxTHG motif protein n=1 Tax=Shewanella maritima TaxID=2520507 RepID=A0A411PLK0_9GAMM|nr:CRISPR-associated DxTHG motif protein [Shewanella maritima]